MKDGTIEQRRNIAREDTERGGAKPEERAKAAREEEAKVTEGMKPETFTAPPNPVRKHGGRDRD